ncbi:MAG: hypothetical protein K0R39_3529 [Symbiobacteriaceae bacterium]|jgi:hypothetical protein|nr:hypothetical protein [Symbiobacteriaceae bacterium]
MRRGHKVGQARPTVQTSTMSRDLDWVLDQWRSSTPEARLQLVLAKIRQEEKMPHEPSKRVI